MRTVELLPVERNVILPDSCRGTGLKKYPWRTMSVVSGRPPRGDSFLVPCRMEEYEQIESRLTSCIRHMRRRHGLIFTTRRVDEGVRVWRLR
jgi:hypothetical protein